MSKNLKNIIFILIDGARFDFVTRDSLYSEIFSKSEWFNRVYTVSPYTIASMHAAFTSLYPKHNGVNGYLAPERLKESVKTMPQLLKEKGYLTICNIPSPVVMSRRGFDYYELHDEYLFENTKQHIECIRRHEREMRERERFFLYFHYSHIHTSLSNRVLKKHDDFSDEYFGSVGENRRIHADDVRKSAEYLSEVISELERANITENSDIWIASDHGVSTGDVVGERAYGVYLFDYTLHTFLIKYGKEQRINDDSFRATIDTMPLIFQRAGLPLPDNVDGMLDRKRRVKRLFKEVETYEPIFLETGGVGGPFPSPEKHNIFGVMDDKRKLIHNRTIDEFEEYEYGNGDERILKKTDSDLRKMLEEYEEDV